MAHRRLLEVPPLAEYRYDESFFGGTPPLSLEAGYALVIGFGLFFSIFTYALVKLDERYGGTVVTSEQFNTAGRSVKTGLTASVIVSQWTWAATLLQSSNVAWQYGVSGPFWYASGATIQILLFGILAIEIKRRAPHAHTLCELVNARWGPPGGGSKFVHFTFIFFAFSCNIIVTSMLLLGGAATVNALTGMNIYLASFFIPWGVIIYTAAGGLKATFLASYIHTAVIFVVLLVMVYTVYVKEYSSDAIYNMLDQVSGYDRNECELIFSNGTASGTFYVNGDYACGPVPRNAQGSYLTMVSGGGLSFGIINIVGNFGTVFVDQSYWQSGIAAKPEAAYKGYMLGGLVWFTIPFALAPSLGLAGVALNLPITVSEAGAGLVPPAVATHLYGSGGALMMAIMLFMAIVSTGSAESIAVSSLVAYDVFGTYFKKSPTSQDILNISRVVIVVFGLFMGVLSIILYEMGLNLGWVYQFMGIMIGSAVCPLYFMLTWDKLPGWGAAAGAWLGCIGAFISWIVTAQIQSGRLNVSTLSQGDAFLVGNLVAILFSGLICLIAGTVSPQNYDWKSMKEIALVKDADEDVKLAPDMAQLKDEYLSNALKTIKLAGWGTSILLCVIWPVLSVPAGVFSKAYFAFWVFIAVVWSLVASTAIIFLPLYESKDAILMVVYGMLGMQYAPAAPPKADLELVATEEIAIEPEKTRSESEA